MLGPNATRKNILKAVNEVFIRDPNSNPVIFYYSGHGAVDENNVGYIAPYDMDPEDPFISGIKMEDLKNAIDNFKVKYSSIIIILDCSHSGIICKTYWWDQI